MSPSDDKVIVLALHHMSMRDKESIERHCCISGVSTMIRNFGTMWDATQNRPQVPRTMQFQSVLVMDDLRVSAVFGISSCHEETYQGLGGRTVDCRC